ncbi:type II secretion system inner membrane protein GspF [Pyxidicoccus fallax]|uniref:Type II secretion system inner membrane protein GspF n=1 Tax=Pyxidicoccus fallax TaxID=394095 RepID=A0A848LUE8_9BACT|nr:type II secretion system inner membrane protein GspF [Pyxidicoccus fallax]NMO21595.1 type II secretion system inner membrane protein GspF [Pyxidicoccus fallax]NPC82822.1 type II secretion system inner membrane protein GspF [Pyxidicoccus fallax]
MPVFEYRGLNAAGKQVKGLLEADSPKTLRSKLRTDGIFLTDVLAQAEGSRAAVAKGANASLVARDIDLRKLGRGRVNTDDVAIFTRQLSTLLGAGVTLVESLSALVDQVEKERFKRALSDIKQRVNEGSSLADAMGQHPKIFPSIYVNMVRAGEASGALDAVLTRLADFTENQARLQQKILSTMLYPAIMMVVGGGILVALMVFVVPKVTKIFETMKATLPLNTRILIASSNFFQDWWFFIVPVMVLGGWLFLRWTKSPKGKPKWDRFTLKAPVIGNLVRLLSISRFARTLSTLLKSGVPMLAAMDIVKAVMTNTVLAEVVEKARDSIREGESIANPLKRSGEFPPLVYHMVAIGERSGQLEEMLTSVADNYENQVNVRITALTSLLEPMLIVVMGAVIAFVALSILMPILQVNSAIR